MESDSKFSMNKQINPAIFAFLNKKTYFRPGFSIHNGAGTASVPLVRTQGMSAFGTRVEEQGLWLQFKCRAFGFEPDRIELACHGEE